MKREKINKVFTPRSSSVNSGMYIERENLEKALYRSVYGSMHSFLFGESGSGKSWLYKKVFFEKNINYIVANCANASRKESITEEIFLNCIGEEISYKTGYKETKKTSVSFGLKAELAHQGQYEIVQEDKLILAFKEISKNGSFDESVIVLDNVETIFKNPVLMDELADIIILLDDSKYAKYGVKFLIVGIPNKVVEYFSSIKNPTSVGNRIEEIPRVAGLTFNQILDLVTKGFSYYLKINLSTLEKADIAYYIHNITLGIPQRVHEFCECLSYEIEENDWMYKKELLNISSLSWLLKGLRESYSLIQKHLNSDKTIAGRKNQVIYSLGQISNNRISTNRLGRIISKEFPNNVPRSNSGIGKILVSLTKGDNPILNKTIDSNSFEFSDPRHLMCIRITFYKNEINGDVNFRSFELN